MQQQTIDELITKAKQAYYETGTPIMSDAEYDKLIETYKGGEDPIGVKPTGNRFPVLKHEIPMSSLNKTKTVEEVKSWMQAMNIQHPEQSIVIEPKYDGLSLAVTYDNYAQLENAILRGDGFEGENVIDNVRKFLPPSLPKLLGHRITIRGEVVISQDNFNKLPAGEYANRRNCVSGIIRRLDGKYCGHLTLIAYDVIFPTAPDVFTSEIQKLGVLKQLNICPTSRCWTYNEKLLEELAAERDGMYLLDGLVLKYNDCRIAGAKGNGANGKPLLHIAYKFPSYDGITYIKDVLWEVGKTRKLTPIAMVEPTTIQGSTIGKVSLASFNQFNKLGLALNKKVLIRRVNDVIPQISASGTEKLVQDRELEAVTIPSVCPSCGAALEERINSEGKVSDLFCSNENCPEALTQMLGENLKSKLKTKGFGESLVRQLVFSGAITNLTDLYKLTPEEIAQNSKLSKERAVKFYELLHTQLKQSSDAVFLSLFFDGVTEKSLKELTSKYSIEEILNLDLESCISIFKKAKGTGFYESKTKLNPYIIEVLSIKNQ